MIQVLRIDRSAGAVARWQAGGDRRSGLGVVLIQSCRFAAHREIVHFIGNESVLVLCHEIIPYQIVNLTDKGQKLIEFKQK
jgi:hypothetical protein